MLFDGSVTAGPSVCFNGFEAFEAHSPVGAVSGDDSTVEGVGCAGLGAGDGPGEPEAAVSKIARSDFIPETTGGVDGSSGMASRN